MNIQHHFLPSLYLKEVRIAAGSIEAKHTHKFNHLSILAEGSVLLTVDGVSTCHTAPDYIMVQAGKEHVVSALTNVLWYCTHVTSETDPEKVDHVLIKEH